MSKGFGFTREIRLIAKVIQTHDFEKVHHLMDKLVQQYSPLQFNEWLSKALETLPKEYETWFYQNLLGSEQYRQMQDFAAETMKQLLVEHGFVSGQDFCSNPNGGIILSQGASKRILAEIPEMDKASFDAAFITVGEVISM
jgi:hypothetical protein